MTISICAILFAALAFTSQLIILRRTFEVVVDLRASIGARRTEKSEETPAGATEDTPPAPRLVQGTLRRSGGQNG
ncbi:hypothetical protein ABZU25_33885 [Micromonospora sp. NPDC005215]|uniref:hypothetical protein n=1 Tax=Micromonospora sp. NPDC005215 TaxID=3157024 RepID=UPI0033AF842F